MPYTIYAKIVRKGKRKHKVRNAPVLSFQEKPIDYFDLKSTVLDGARNIYREHNQTISIISIDKHLGGKYIRATTNYREARIHYNRQPEMKAKIQYNSRQDSVKILSAVFITPDFYEFKADFDREKGKKWKLKPLVEKGFEATLLNPESATFNLLTVKNVVYDPKATEVYASHQERQHTHMNYDRAPQGVYGIFSEITLERDKAERESSR